MYYEKQYVNRNDEVGEVSMKFRGILSGLLLMTVLYGCGVSCPPAPANPMPDSPFRGYRLGALVIETADSPSQPFSREIFDVSRDKRYRPYYYPQTREIIRDAFSKPGDNRYNNAPVVNMLCSMEDVYPGISGSFSDKPARFAGKISIIDPATKRTVASKKCEFDADAIQNSVAGKCGQRGLPGLSDVIHQCLRQFASEMKPSVLKPQPAPGALLDGTFTGVTTSFTPTAPDALEKLFLDGNAWSNFIMSRLVTDEMSTVLSKTIVDNTSFSNSVANTYSVAVEVHDSEILSGVLHLLHDQIRYTAVTTILKNGKPVGRFTFTAPKSLLDERFSLYESHGKAILGYLRDHAAELNKK